MKKLVTLAVATLLCCIGFEAYGMAVKQKNIVTVEAPKGFPKKVVLVPIDAPMGKTYGGASFEKTFESRSIMTDQNGNHKLLKPFTIPEIDDIALLVFVNNSDTGTIFTKENIDKLSSGNYSLVIDADDKATLKMLS